MAKILFVAATFCCLYLVGASPAVTSILELTKLKEDSHNINQCPDPTAIADSPLCQLHIQQSAKWFDTITQTIHCPNSGVNKVKIACIIVKDNVANDDGGYASITSGGLNQYSVQIYLKSQWGKGIDFDITVYTESASNSTLV
ncbi:uncharacterized protein LOC126745115 [Anthonomus grandis grandis]|uniref:uncharacterized protein LOC126745115 n=1 Tax=Anthonomus grandis grandis TaxID=2921223 RepID=UPI002165D99E|nr:uncharacterized protein LOC126745115 [Anthonomus grandis grandis]